MTSATKDISKLLWSTHSGAISFWEDIMEGAKIELGLK